MLIGSLHQAPKSKKKSKKDSKAKSVGAVKQEAVAVEAIKQEAVAVEAICDVKVAKEDERALDKVVDSVAPQITVAKMEAGTGGTLVKVERGTDEVQGVKEEGVKAEVLTTKRKGDELGDMEDVKRVKTEV
jgi:putative IMPACT (imprinted ancient) family translation regulator